MKINLKKKALKSFNLKKIQKSFFWSLLQYFSSVTHRHRPFSLYSVFEF